MINNDNKDINVFIEINIENIKEVFHWTVLISSAIIFTSLLGAYAYKKIKKETKK